MTKPENSISFDDIMEVFSSVENKKLDPEKTEVKIISEPENASLPEIEVKKAEQDKANDYGIQGAPGAAELFKAYNEIGEIIRKTLLSFVNEKAANKMMLGSLEKTALNYPVLKGTNWDRNEKLREDGSIDVDTAEKNALKDNSGTVENFCEALSYLTYIRLKAVKTGAGRERYEQVKNVLLVSLEASTAGYSKAVAWHIKNKVVIPAVKRGDETQ